jgi:hypothetical protein
MSDESQCDVSVFLSAPPNQEMAYVIYSSFFRASRVPFPSVRCFYYSLLSYIMPIVRVIKKAQTRGSEESRHGVAQVAHRRHRSSFMGYKHMTQAAAAYFLSPANSPHVTPHQPHLGHQLSTK